MKGKNTTGRTRKSSPERPQEISVDISQGTTQEVAEKLEAFIEQGGHLLRADTNKQKRDAIVEARREATPYELDEILVDFGLLSYADKLMMMELLDHLASTPQSSALAAFFTGPYADETGRLRPITMEEHILWQLQRQLDPTKPAKETIAVPTGALEILEI